MHTQKTEIEPTLFEKISRRNFLLISAILSAMATLFMLVGCGPRSEEQQRQIEDLENEILKKIKELQFVPGSELRTTLLFRKIEWEMQQARGGNNSEWINNLENMRAAIELLANAGISGARLVIFPFEITQNGYDMNWTAMDTAIEMLASNNIKVDLCVGPLDFPYAPGIRLPLDIERSLLKAFQSSGQTAIHIDANADDFNLPDISRNIREYSTSFLKQLMDRYGNDDRIHMICLGNEWPDTHGIEGSGLDGKTMTVSSAMMMEYARIIKERTTKPVMLNTNIHPARAQEIIHGPLGEILRLLGAQAVLGLDVYPTEEETHPEEKQAIQVFDSIVQQLIDLFPGLEVMLGEFQAEIFAKEGMAGKSWAQIFDEYPDLVMSFFTEQFPKTLETHVIKSGIKKTSLWGAPMWLALALKNYLFPLKMVTAIAQRMKECSQ